MPRLLIHLELGVIPTTLKECRPSIVPVRLTPTFPVYGNDAN